MRALFWILLLGNVILFAAIQRGGLGWGEQAYQQQPVLHEEKVRLLDANQSAPAKALPIPAKTTAPIANPAPAANPDQTLAASEVPTVMPALVSDKQDNLICLEWGDFSGADLKRATEVLSTMQLGDKLSQRQIAFDKGYWVYFPPQKNMVAANKKVSQIKALGVKEYFIVQDAGASRYSISLGVFKTKDAAQNYLHELRTKGVRTARVGERTRKLKTTIFILNMVDVLTEAKLSATRKDFPESELKNVPCALTR